MRRLPALALLLLVAVGHRRQPAARQVAVTFDDLPVVSTRPLDDADRAAITTVLLQGVRRHRVPAIGFVNEDKLADSTGTPDPARVALLGQWLDAGLELGNHTRSHQDLHRVTLDAYEDGIIRGDSITRSLLRERGQVPRFFRHPYLHTGRSVAVRDSLLQFLAAHGYRVAPVTIDNSDYLYAAAYDQAHLARDTAAAARVEAAYLTYMESVVTFYEQQSVAILGREIPQILLLHASRLNARTFDQLATMLERRGYRFVPLDSALTDSAYGLPDRYTGPGGITWLHRWAITKGTPGKVFRGEPEVPEWVEKMGAK